MSAFDRNGWKMNLIERLRGTCTGDVTVWTALTNEAADEIERLQADSPDADELEAWLASFFCEPMDDETIVGLARALRKTYELRRRLPICRNCGDYTDGHRVFCMMCREMGCQETAPVD